MRRLKTTQVKAVRNKLLANQGARCALCQIEISEDQAVLDHNHTTGFLREVLCRNCNGIEGKISNLANRAKRKHTREWFLQRLIQYWDKHSVAQTDLVYPTHKTDDEKRLRANKKARERRAAAKG